MISVMSTSLKVVSIAAVFCASLSRRAMVWRNLVRRTRSSREASSGAEGARKAIGAGSGAIAGATGAGAGLGGSGLAPSGLGDSDLAISCSTSPSSTWPRLPLPVTALRSMPFSTAIFAADGAGGIAVAAEGLEAGALASALAGADADAAVDADDTAPSNAPIDTVSPVWADTSDSTPGAGALISSVTLSVSSSTNGSSAFTASPRCLNHLPTVASVIDSPRVGTRISVAMTFAPRGALLLRGDGGNRRQGRHRTDPHRRHRKILVTEAAPGQDRGIASLQRLQPRARWGVADRDAPSPLGIVDRAEYDDHAGIHVGPPIILMGSHHIQFRRRHVAQESLSRRRQLAEKVGHLLFRMSAIVRASANM